MSGRRLGRCGCSPSCKTMASTSSLLGANREVEMVAGGLDNIEAIALYMGSDACCAVPWQSSLQMTPFFQATDSIPTTVASSKTFPAFISTTWPAREPPRQRKRWPKPTYSCAGEAAGCFLPW